MSVAPSASANVYIEQPPPKKICTKSFKSTKVQLHVIAERIFYFTQRLRRPSGVVLTKPTIRRDSNAAYSILGWKWRGFGVVTTRFKSENKIWTWRTRLTRC
jgi:hypothetical protein